MVERNGKATWAPVEVDMGEGITKRSRNGLMANMILGHSRPPARSDSLTVRTPVSILATFLSSLRQGDIPTRCQGF